MIKNNKAQAEAGRNIYLAIAAIVVLIIILYTFIAPTLKTGTGYTDSLNPSCEKRGGTCQKELCEEFIDFNDDLGAYKCKDDEYCCKS